MLDELEIIRRTLEAPAVDVVVRERARSRLLEAIASETVAPAPVPRHAPLRRYVLLVAAAIVALGIVVRLAWPAPHDELRSLASAAASGAPLRVPPGSYLYLSSSESATGAWDGGTISDQNVVSGETVNLSVRTTIETWIRPDGSGTRITTYDHVSFVTDQDYQTWKASTPRLDIPREGETHVDLFKRGELTLYDLSSLPTDPARLLPALRTGEGKAGLDDQQVADEIATVLADADPSPALRSGLLEVLSGLPGIESLGDAVDPIGRPGTAVLIPDGDRARELIFDPATSAVLADIQLADGVAHHWTVFQPPAAVDSLTAAPPS